MLMLFFLGKSYYLTCPPKCSVTSHDNGGSFNTVMTNALQNLGIDTVFLTGSLSESAMYSKELGYITYIVRDGIKEYSTDDLEEMSQKGIGILDSTTLLQDRYHCPNDWLECPLTGDCIPKVNQCDNYFDCHDGFDEDPKEIISKCCDEFILSGMDTLSGLWYQKYMGSYEKVSCSRYIFFFFVLLMYNVHCSACQNISLKFFLSNKIE